MDTSPSSLLSAMPLPSRVTSSFSLRRSMARAAELCTASTLVISSPLPAVEAAINEERQHQTGSASPDRNDIAPPVEPPTGIRHYSHRQVSHNTPRPCSQSTEIRFVESTDNFAYPCPATRMRLQ